MGWDLCLVDEQYRSGVVIIMVGGEVVDMWRWDENVKIIVKGIDGDEGLLRQELKTSPMSLTIMIGGVVWWQQKKAFYTSKDRSIVNGEMERIGTAVSVDSPVLVERKNDE